MVAADMQAVWPDQRSHQLDRGHKLLEPKAVAARCGRSLSESAGGTSSFAATDVGMRHMMSIAGFENGQALKHPDCSVRIG